MKVITAVSQNILKEVISSLTVNNFISLENFSFLGKQKTGHFQKLISTSDVSIVIIDIRVFNSKSIINDLKELRLAFPKKRFILLTPKASFFELYKTELFALTIYDVIPYKASVKGKAQLYKNLSFNLSHSVTLEACLNDYFPSIKSTASSQKNKTFIAIASLEEKAGVTHLAFSLAVYLQKKFPTLFVELSSKTYILKKYILDEAYYNPLTELHDFPQLRNCQFYSFNEKDNWKCLVGDYSFIILDFGVIDFSSDNDMVREFIRSDIPILVSASAPWNIGKIKNLSSLINKVSLWINFSSKTSFKNYSYLLKEDFFCILGGAYSPNLLSITKEEEVLFKRLLTLYS